MCIAYFQPITRGELSIFFGKEISRELIGPSAWGWPNCFRSAHPDTRRTLHLCHDQGIPAAVRLRYTARPTRLRGVGGRRAAVERKAAGGRRHARLCRLPRGRRRRDERIAAHCDGTTATFYRRNSAIMLNAHRMRRH